MQSHYNDIFPIGLALCSKHYKLEQRKHEAVAPVRKELIIQDDFADIDAVDPEYEPEDVTISDEIHEVSVQSGNDIAAVLEASPIKFCLKRKLEHIDDTTKEQLVWKYKRLEKLLKAKFAESLAPGQEMEFLEMLEHNESDDGDADVPEDVKKIN